MTNQNSNNNVLKNELYSLADDLGHLVLREHQILQAEMKQLGKIVGDAVESLDSSFRQINAGASEQTGILNDAFKDARVDESQLRRSREISETISRHTATTVRVLQFDDIVQQLAGHACDRIARMQELFGEIESLLARVKMNDNFEPEQVVRQISAMHKEVDRFRVMLEKENPVKQNSLDEGRIELF